VQAVMKKGGWSQVSDAYATLPASTEQIMHPEKFLANEKPVKIELADLTATLGRDWKRIVTDVNGEFGYQVLLTEFIQKHTARNAADGWGGDKYATYEESQKKNLLIAQFTVWDSEKDAQDFFEAYCQRIEKRYNAKRPADLYAKPRVYETGEGLVAIELRDKDVVILEGAKTGDQLKRATLKLWKSRKS
jgi:hypothetical protein